MSPDWNPTTHTTWQTIAASNISPKMQDRTFLKRFAKMRWFQSSKSVLVFVLMAQYRWLIRYLLPQAHLHKFFKMITFEGFPLLKVHLHKYKKLYSLDKDAWSRFWLCFLWHIFFLINHTKCSLRSAIALRKLQSLLRNKLSDYCLKKPELIYQSRMKGSICYCSVQSTTGLACY